MKTKRLETRVTEKEKKLIVKLAKTYEMSISEFIRYCATLNYTVMWTRHNPAIKKK